MYYANAYTKEEAGLATHDIPRNVKGEGRILSVFSTKALIYTVIGGMVGLIFYWLFSQIKLTYVGIAIALVFAGIGFVIGTFKVPTSTNFEITRKTGGENIDDVILRLIKFKKKKKRIYLYTKEEKK